MAIYNPGNVQRKSEFLDAISHVESDDLKRFLESLMSEHMITACLHLNGKWIRLQEMVVLKLRLLMRVEDH